MSHNATATSRVIAHELRQAERSIHTATLDAAQFLTTSLQATDTLGLSPSFSLGAVKATVDAIQSLLESQRHIALRAHPQVEKIGESLGLTVVDWGEGAPKPSSAETPDELTVRAVSADATSA